MNLNAKTKKNISYSGLLPNHNKTTHMTPNEKTTNPNQMGHYLFTILNDCQHFNMNMSSEYSC